MTIILTSHCSYDNMPTQMGIPDKQPFTKVYRDEFQSLHWKLTKYIKGIEHMQATAAWGPGDDTLTDHGTNAEQDTCECSDSDSGPAAVIVEMDVSGYPLVPESLPKKKKPLEQYLRVYLVKHYSKAGIASCPYV